VVVVPEVNALSGPGEEFKQILLLHDGTEVRIRELRGDYLLVQVPGGGGGWRQDGRRISVRNRGSLSARRRPRPRLRRSRSRSKCRAAPATHRRPPTPGTGGGPE